MTDQKRMTLLAEVQRLTGCNIELEREVERLQCSLVGHVWRNVMTFNKCKCGNDSIEIHNLLHVQSGPWVIVLVKCRNCGECEPVKVEHFADTQRVTELCVKAWNDRHSDLTLKYGLLEISFNHKSVLLDSCEKALVDRDEKISELNAWCKRLERQVVEMDDDYDQLKRQLREHTT